MRLNQNLEFRCSYRARDGRLIHVWSDPNEPWLEDFDQAVICPAEWVQGNARLLADPRPRTRHRREREDRQSLLR